MTNSLVRNYRAEGRYIRAEVNGREVEFVKITHLIEMEDAERLARYIADLLNGAVAQ